MPKPGVGARDVNSLQRIKEGQRKIKGVREWGGRAGEEPRIGSVRPPTAGAWGVMPPTRVSLCSHSPLRFHEREEGRVPLVFFVLFSY